MVYPRRWILVKWGTGDWEIVANPELVNITWDDRPVYDNYWMAYADWLKVRGMTWNEGRAVLRTLLELSRVYYP